VLPRRLQVDFSAAAQRLTDESGHEVTPQQIFALFQQEYVDTRTPLHYVGDSLSERVNREYIRLTVDIHGQRTVVSGEGNGPLDALMHTLCTPCASCCGATGECVETVAQVGNKTSPRMGANALGAFSTDLPRGYRAWRRR
jgi:hypothetical protein